MAARSRMRIPPSARDPGAFLDRSSALDVLCQVPELLSWLVSSALLFGGDLPWPVEAAGSLVVLAFTVILALRVRRRLAARRYR